MKIFSIKFSVWLCLLFIFLYGGAFLCIVCANIFLPLKLFLALLLTIHLVITAKKYLFLTAPQAIVALSVDNQGWNCYLKSGECFPVTVSSGSVITRYISILNFKNNLTRKQFTLILLPDALLPESFRQLRVRLLT